MKQHNERKENMKKFCLLLVVFCMLSITACSNGGGKKPSIAVPTEIDDIEEIEANASVKANSNESNTSPLTTESAHDNNRK